MANKLLIAKIKEALERQRQKTTEERWQAMIDRGIINQKGEVIVGKKPKKRGKSDK